MTITADIIVVLMSWASLLSGYENPEVMPQIRYADHSHFIENLCEGIDTEKEPCVARAYYNDDTDAIIYLNTKYWEINREWTPYQHSIIVHEMVHYLQDISGKYDGYEYWDEDRLCAARKERQIEAYTTQDKFLLRLYDSRRKFPRRYAECGWR